MNDVIQYRKTTDLIEDACTIIGDAQRAAYYSVNVTLVLRNWLLGKRICEEALQGDERAEYGAEVIKNLSVLLSERYGKGFSSRTLYKCRQFYKAFPEIVPSLSAKSDHAEILPIPA